ncbi:P-loop containing nucleoside triphosphate hydrolases superfamily protein isoform X1 [Carex rostrata]
MAFATSHSIFSSPPQQQHIYPETRPWSLLRLSPASPLFPPNRACTFSCRAQSVAQQATRTRTLRELCHGRVPESILMRSEEVGYVTPTDVQEQSLPVLLSRQDCVLHAQTGSGKTLAYLLAVFSAINSSRSTVQAVIVVPTRELGMQVTKVARMLAAKPKGAAEKSQKECSIMALLDGGMLTRQKSWLKAEPPQIIIATIESLCRMIDRHLLKLQSISILVIDEFDYIFGSTKQVALLRKLLGSYSSSAARQTVFASASIPQHNRFLYDCVQQKWTKKDVVHVHVNPVEPMPSHLHHKFLMCTKKERLQVLLQLLHRDKPKSGIIFVLEQSEKSRNAGHSPSTTVVYEFLKDSYDGDLEILLLEQDMHFNARSTSFLESRQKGFLLVSTDIASRGFDLPQTTHIYNFDLPKTAIDYLHRAGRTGRNPLLKEVCTVTTLITQEERFVLRKFEGELMFQCEELSSL